MTIRVLDPTQPPEVLPARIAPRRAPDRPIVLGCLSNSKPNAGRLLKMIAEQLRDRLQIESTVEAAKPNASLNAPEETLDQLAERCDMAIVAVGD